MTGVQTCALPILMFLCTSGCEREWGSGGGALSWGGELESSNIDRLVSHSEKTFKVNLTLYGLLCLGVTESESDEGLRVL